MNWAFRRLCHLRADGNYTRAKIESATLQRVGWTRGSSEGQLPADSVEKLRFHRWSKNSSPYRKRASRQAEGLPGRSDIALLSLSAALAVNNDRISRMNSHLAEIRCVRNFEFFNRIGHNWTLAYSRHSDRSRRSLDVSAFENQFVHSGQSLLTLTRVPVLTPRSRASVECQCIQRIHATPRKQLGER